MRVRRTALLLVAVAFGLQALALIGVFQCQVGLYQDEGYVLECSSRMLQGELPYRDFATRFMPATNWLLNLFFGALGETVVAMRLYFVLMAAALAASVQWFSSRILPRGWSELPTILFLCLGVQAWPMVSFHWDATIFTLIALGLLAGRWAPEPSGARAVLLAGGLCGITVLFLESKGLATCVGAGLLLLLEPLPFKTRLGNLGLLIGGAALPGLAFVLWLCLNGLPELFFQNVVGFTASRYLVLHRAPLDLSPLGLELTTIGQGLATFGQPDLGAWLGWFWRAASFTAVDFVKFGGYYPVLLLGTALAFRRARRRPWTPSEAGFLGLVLVLILASLFDFGRPNRYRLHFQAPLWNTALIYLLWALSEHWRRLGRGLAGLVLLAYLGQGLDNLTSWGAYRYPVDFPRGRLYFREERQAAYLQRLSSSLAQIVPPGTPVYAFPQQNLLPWLQANPNPSANIETIPVLHDREDLLQVRRLIEQRKMPWLLYSPLDPGLNGDYPQVKREDFEREQNWMRDLFSEGYEPALETPDLTLYRRRE